MGKVLWNRSQRRACVSVDGYSNYLGRAQGSQGRLSSFRIGLYPSWEEERHSKQKKEYVWRVKNRKLAWLFLHSNKRKIILLSRFCWDQFELSKQICILIGKWEDGKRKQAKLHCPNELCLPCSSAVTLPLSWSCCRYCVFPVWWELHPVFCQGGPWPVGDVVETATLPFMPHKW